MTIRETLALLHRAEQGLSGPSNGFFAATDTVFRKACALAGIEPSARQASKWRNSKGKAWLFRREALASLEEERQALARNVRRSIELSPESEDYRLRQIQLEARKVK